MKEKFKLVQFERKKNDKYPLDFLSLEKAKKVQRFHESFPVYEKLKLDEISKVLFFSTEGDTDKESYKAIVW